MFIQCNYALVVQVAGKYLPSSDVIKTLRAGTPRETGAEVRALLSGTLCILSANWLYRTSRQRVTKPKPHLLWLCSAVAFIFPGLKCGWRVQNYKTAIPFLVSETSVIWYSASPPKNKAQFVFPSLSSPSITPCATLAMKSAEASVQTFSQQGDQGVNLT